MKNYFNAEHGVNNKHLSVGAVLYNDEGKVLVHHHTADRWPEKYKHFGNLYVLMRESLEQREVLEDALARGLMEEFGAVGEIEHFLGSIIAEDIWSEEFVKEDINPEMVQKTTLYFLVKLVSIDESKRLKGDPESGSELLWMSIDEIIEEQKIQFERIKKNHVNEIVALKEARKILFGNVE